jgi:hypothetical protein
MGFYRGKDLIYAARVRAGLVPATRRELFEKLKHLRTLRISELKLILKRVFCSVAPQYPTIAPPLPMIPRTARANLAYS